ncbi:unnamed protein product [Sphacelaria rigidula]
MHNHEYTPLPPTAKKLKLRFRVRDLDLPERRKRYTSSRVEEKVNAPSCSRGEVIRDYNSHSCSLVFKRRNGTC